MTLAALAALALLAAPTPAARLDDLAWMAGTWTGQDGALQMEEVWTAPRGGTLLGLHRDVKGEHTVSFEFLRIEQDAEGLVYRAMPQGRPATDFRAVEVGTKRVVFANPAHDFPKRILYWLDAEGALHARVEGDPGGQEKAMEWTWKKRP